MSWTSSKKPTTLKKAFGESYLPSLKMVSFVTTLSIELGIKPRIEKDYGVSNDYIRGRVLKRIYSRTTMVEFLTDDYRLVFIPHLNDQINLYKIEVREPNKGVGTSLMNTILDICDELDLVCVLHPTQFTNCFGVHSDRTFLIEWYESFGFVKNTLTDMMIYTPNKL